LDRSRLQLMHAARFQDQMAAPAWPHGWALMDGATAQAVSGKIDQNEEPFVILAGLDGQ
jgi:hypothetical protein